MKRLLIVPFVLGALWLTAATVFARDAAPAGDIPAAALPAEARATLELIRKGGPFGNREKILPAQARGYYREYTVPTPGARDRGARRIVAGAGAAGDVRISGEYYYSDDHYNSFRRIRE
jgi:ribonuclease T1